MGNRLEFNVLGPLDVRAPGGAVTVGGLRQRTVLAMLLLSPDRVVSVDSLVEAVWDGRPPATGRTQIAICVAGLRKTFKAAGCDDDVITTSSPGYRLISEGHLIDALEFQQQLDEAHRIAQQGKASAAAEQLERSLARWRGPAFAGLSGHVIDAESARLEELRLTAHERRTALRLELGQHRELIGELTALVKANPLREQARAHLMLAQHRSGRRAEALETFRQGREHFIEELGMEPGTQLQELQNALLRDDPSLTVTTAAPAAQAVVPAQLPPTTPAFTGRVRELSTLDTLVDGEDPEDALTIAFLTGAAGTGKTELALRWAHRVAHRFPDGQIFVDLHGFDEEQRPAAVGDVLAGILRAFGVADERIPAECDERAALYRSVLSGRRVLVVLDNAESFAQARPLLPGGGDCCVLVTSRDQLSELLGGYGARRLRLTGLERAESVALLDGMTGSRNEPTAMVRLAELCDDLPLALRIAGAQLASRPHCTVGHLVRALEDQRRRLDELSPGDRGVRARFAPSYHRLDPAAARMFRLLGLLDAPDFAVWVGAAALDTTCGEAERLMEQLVDAHLLEIACVDLDGRVRYSFQELFRLYARERALAEESAQDRATVCERAFAAWLELVTLAQLGGEVCATWLEPDQVEQVLVDPLRWFETERSAVAASVEQAHRMELIPVAAALAAPARALAARCARPMSLSGVPETTGRRTRWLTELPGGLAS